MRMIAALAVVALASTSASAQERSVTSYALEGDLADAAFGIETAIVDRGFVIDYVSHVGEMLNRTAADVGATRQVYSQADVYLFCSSVLSRKVMEADPANIGHCPYGIFAYELADSPGTTHIGYRHMPEGPMQEVQQLLDEIAREAAGVD